ncbi:MAG: c-type cytochrome, partial [Gemmataceae bacterium]|nr:c-type cytochrome [Gemmataceae bacterium]
MTMHAAGHLSTSTAFEVLLGWSHRDEIRGGESILDWVVERLYEPERFADWSRSAYDRKFMLKLAAVTPHGFGPFLRVLQRLPLKERWPLAEALVGNQSTNPDVSATLLLWYGIEPLVPDDPPRAVQLATKARQPLVRQFLARRVAGLGDGAIDHLVTVIGTLSETEVQLDLLRGIQAALAGRRRVKMPAHWQTAYDQVMKRPHPALHEAAVALAVVFGDERAVGLLQKTLMDEQAPPAQRRLALRSLLGQRPPELVPKLQALLDSDAMRAAVIPALAAYADPKTPALILERYAKFTPDEKADAIHTLASRPAYALALLDAIADKTVARQDLNAFTVRQLLALNDPRVTARVNEVWGTLRPAGADKAVLLAKYKAQLTADALRQANLANGRLLFKHHCAQCHKLFGEGGDIGPELTGSQRANLDYLLENMLDPSAVVPREYQVSVIVTDSGRTITGIVKEESERAVTVQTQNELMVLPKSEIDSRRLLKASMMPEGVLDRLTRDEVRDLVAYLASPVQVALPAERK